MEMMRSVRRERDVWDAEFVSMVWFIPLYMGWQEERVARIADRVEYMRATNEATTVVMDLLGTY